MVRNYAQDKRNRLAKAAQQHSSSLDSHFIRPKNVANQAVAGEGTEAEAEENNAQGVAGGDGGGGEAANDVQSIAANASDVGGADAADENDIEEDLDGGESDDEINNNVSFLRPLPNFDNTKMLTISLVKFRCRQQKQKVLDGTYASILR
jgi:hypothetical protein